ncbi:lipopolysaccharide biosynthesis protein [Thermosipho africanus]|uniref:lipopolysaccharide biosynthesis protein n=1 Tax=Thermosipho africanus TaxID=2421 RepID=UPI0002F817A6|nr:oligosaccharide flippase family protein [Thermosipho africanus]
MKIKNTVENTIILIKKGLLHVFFGDLSSKVFRFLSMIVMTRLLDKEQYGIWNYAYNIYSLILLFDGLGIASGVLQYCSKERNERKRFLIFKFGKSFGEYVNLFISFLL